MTGRGWPIGLRRDILEGTSVYLWLFNIKADKFKFSIKRLY